MIVAYADAEPNGLAAMLGGLLEANLAREPQRRTLLRPAVVALTATDAGVSVTLRVGDGRIEVVNGSSNARADLRVHADSRELLHLPSAPLRFGLPDIFTANGRRVVGKLLSGDVRVHGLFRHPRKLARLTALLSVT